MGNKNTIEPLLYINSKDVKNYLEHINYEFNTVEIAWLIYQCKSLTVFEKHDAWETLMNSSEDVDMSAYKSFRLKMSLFEYIKKFIELEKEIIYKFNKEETGCVYFHNGEIERNGMQVFAGDFIPYSTLDKCISSMIELYSDDCDANDIAYIEITKSYIDDLGEISAIMDVDKNILSVSNYSVSEEDEEIISKGFATLYLDFPLPFKPGDLVWNEFGTTDQKMPVVYCKKSQGLALVRYARLGYGYNETALSAKCYQVSRSHKIEPCSIYNYMNLTYYSDNTEDIKPLGFLSDYMHGELEEKDYKKFCMMALANNALDFSSYKFLPEEIDELYRHVHETEVNF